MALFGQFYIYSWRVLLPVLVLSAWRWGGRPEKTAALMYLVAAIASQLVRPANIVAFVHIEWPLLAIDAMLAVGLIILALTSDRFWPLPSAAFQVLSCLAHIHKIIEPRSYSLGYQLMAQASIYPTLLLLGFGIWRQRKRTAKTRMP